MAQIEGEQEIMQQLYKQRAAKSDRYLVAAVISLILTLGWTFHMLFAGIDIYGMLAWVITLTLFIIAKNVKNTPLLSNR